MLLREAEIVRDQDKENRKRIEEKLRLANEETITMKKLVQEVKMEKEKCMELGLMEKL